MIISCIFPDRRDPTLKNESGIGKCHAFFKITSMLLDTELLYSMQLCIKDYALDAFWLFDAPSYLLKLRTLSVLLILSYYLSFGVVLIYCYLHQNFLTWYWKDNGWRFFGRNNDNLWKNHLASFRGWKMVKAWVPVCLLVHSAIQ